MVAAAPAQRHGGRGAVAAATAAERSLRSRVGWGPAAGGGAGRGGGRRRSGRGRALPGPPQRERRRRGRGPGAGRITRDHDTGIRAQLAGQNCRELAGELHVFDLLQRGAAAAATSWAIRDVPGTFGRSGDGDRVVQRRQQDARRRLAPARGASPRSRPRRGASSVEAAERRAACRAAPRVPSSLGSRPMRFCAVDVGARPQPRDRRQVVGGDAGQRQLGELLGRRGLEVQQAVRQHALLGQPLAHAGARRCPGPRR